MSANGTVYELAQEKFNNVKQKVCVFGNGVTLKPGSFGIGLFAEKNFSKGDPITLYGGQLIDMQTAKKRLQEKKDSHIRRHIARHFCFDGTYLPDGSPITNATEQLVGLPIGAFCNDNAEEDKINARFEFIDSAENEKRFAAFDRGFGYNPDPNERLTFIEATRDILAGEEIFCAYGTQYWERSAEKKQSTVPPPQAKPKKKRPASTSMESSKKLIISDESCSTTSTQPTSVTEKTTTPNETL